LPTHHLAKVVHHGLALHESLNLRHGVRLLLGLSLGLRLLPLDHLALHLLDLSRLHAASHLSHHGVLDHLLDQGLLPHRINLFRGRLILLLGWHCILL